MFKDNCLKQLGKGILMFCIFYYSAYLQYIPIFLFRIRNITPQISVLLSSFSSVMIMILFYFIYRSELKKEWLVFKNNFGKNMDVGFKYWIIGLIVMMISNILLNSLFNAGQADNEQVVQGMIKTLPFVMLIDAGLISPFNEELVFRKCFYNVFKNKWAFAISSGFIFGLLHVLGAKSLIDFLFIIPYGFLGSMFAVMYFETKTIFTSYSMHLIHNTILILLSISAL